MALHKMKIGIRNTDDSISPLGKFYIGDETPIQINIDSMELVHLAYDAVKKIFQVQYNVGGYGPDGEFHEAPAYMGIPHMIRWSRVEHKNIWQLYDLNRFFKLYVEDAVNTIAEWMHEGDSAKTIARRFEVSGDVVGYITSANGATVLTPPKPRPPVHVVIPYEPEVP